MVRKIVVYIVIIALILSVLIPSVSIFMLSGPQQQTESTPLPTNTGDINLVSPDLSGATIGDLPSENSGVLVPENTDSGASRDTSEV